MTVLIAAALGIIAIGFVCYLSGREHGYKAGHRDGYREGYAEGFGDGEMDYAASEVTS